MEIIDIIVAVALIVLLSPYITFVLNLLTALLPVQILKFGLLVIIISIIAYIFNRKDD